MATFVITPAAGGALTFADVIANFDAIGGQYWDVVTPSGPKTEKQEIAAGGVDGVAIVRAGFRAQRIVADVYIVGANRAACMTLLANLDAAWNSPCSVAVPNGQTYPSADLEDYEVIEPATDTGYSTCVMKVRIFMEEHGNA